MPRDARKLPVRGQVDLFVTQTGAGHQIGPYTVPQRFPMLAFIGGTGYGGLAPGCNRSVDIGFLA